MVFSTFDTLLPADRYEGLDVYERVDGRLRLVSKRRPRRTAPDNDWSWLDVQLRGQKNGKPRAIFATDASFLPADRERDRPPTKQRTDIYEYVDGRLRLLTHAPAFPDICDGESCDYQLLQVGADGRTVYLSTKAKLSLKDRDSRRDIYALAGSRRTLITGGSRPGGGNAVDIPRDSYNDPPYRIYEDGSVAFTTHAALTEDDENSKADAYLFQNGHTELLSPPRPAGAGDWAIGYVLSDSVPGRIFPVLGELSYESPAPPGRINLYRVDRGGEPIFVYSADPDHTHSQFSPPEVVLDQPDGTIYFRTADRIDPLDTDDKPDLYRWDDGELTMISVGPRGSEGPGNRPEGDYGRYAVMREDGLYFVSVQRLVFEDRNFDSDLYRYSDGEVTLLSTDRNGNALNGGVDAVRMLGDGGVVVATRERWVPADRNLAVDLYLRRGEEVFLINPTGQVQRRSRLDWSEFGQHLGQNRFAFESGAALVAVDSDQSTDVYFSRVGPGRRALRLISRGKLEILRGPNDAVSREDPRATFIFAQQGPRPRYLCSLDGRRTRPCKSPITYRNLAPGKHTFAVASVGPHGLGRKAARSWLFRVRRDDPRVSLEVTAVSTDGNRAVATRQEEYSRHGGNLVYRTGTEPVFLYNDAGGRLTAADRDLDRVVVSTKDRLDPADDDATSDFYGWWGETPFLFPAGQNIFGPPETLLASNDLKTVVFETFARLHPADVDFGADVYSWGPEGYHLLSGGSALESPARLAGPDALSGDGSSVVFSTGEALLPGDTDDQLSLYWSDGDAIRYLVRDGIPRQEEGEWVMRDRPSVVALADDGGRVILEMPPRLVPGGESDWHTRVYEWTPHNSPPLREIREGTVATGIGSSIAYPRAVSADASTVLIADRQDWRPAPLFRSSGGDVEPVYPPKPHMKMHLNAFSPDLAAIAVETGAALDPEDMNGTLDTYLLAGGTATWLTRRPGESDERRRASVPWLSTDGDEALFFTKSRLLPADRDERGIDFYRFAAGKLRLLSPGKRFPDRQTRDYPGTVQASANGVWIYFTSDASLLPGDPAGTVDIYRVSRNGDLERMPAPKN